MFSSGALSCLALKVRHGQYLATCSLTCTAMQGQRKWLHIRSSMHSRPKWPTSSWHPFRVVCLCAASKTRCNRTLGRVFLYRMPHLSLRWLHSQMYCQSSRGSVCLSWHWPRVLSCNLAITRLKTGSAH